MTDYEKLKEIIDEIPVLVDHRVKKTTPGFQAWYTKTERFLTKRYGEESIELRNFKNTSFSIGMYLYESQEADKCREGLVATKLTFEAYLDEIEEEPKDIPVAQQNTYDKVFIVHGHDGALKEAVARIIEKQGIEAIILSEQASTGRTIIEKFEDHSDVSGAICLFTADDVGNVKTASEYNPRARQNVIFETGYFIGKLGRNHIVILADKGVEMPSDLSGVLYTDAAHWQVDLLKELKAMGYMVDYNKLF